MTMTFGLAMELQIVNEQVEIDTSMMAGLDGVHSTYMFSKHYIQNHLMPNLWMQWKIEQDSAHLESYHYWESILIADSIAVANAIPSEALSVGTGELNNNISFDAGASLSYKASSTQGYSRTHEVKVAQSHKVFGEFGFTIDKFGFGVTYAHTWAWEDDKVEIDENTYTQTTSFKLDDNDPGDAFSVNVLQDTTWGSMVFQVIGGQSSRPWEPGTLQRQQVQFAVEPSIANNVAPNTSAQFTLTLGNSSETNEEWDYNLRLINESNPDGAILRIGGQPLGSAVFPYTVAGGQQHSLLLTIDRGPTAFEYDDIELLFYAPYEFSRWQSTGIPIPPGLADTVSVSVHFTEPCGGQPVIAIPQNGWAANSRDSLYYLSITGYNIHDEALQFLLVEYQHIAGESSIKSTPSGSSPQTVNSKNGEMRLSEAPAISLPPCVCAISQDNWFVVMQTPEKRFINKMIYLK
jgi:hypothetical protein